MSLDAGAEVLGTGLAFPVRAGRNPGRILLATGEDDVEQAVRIILSTVPGERVMRPEFGCNLHEFVFEHLDGATLGRIDQAIRVALHRWEPRIVVEGVEFETEQEGAVPHRSTTTLFIHVTYSIRATMTRRNLVYPFYLVPAGEKER